MHHRTRILIATVLLMAVLARGPALGAVTFLRTRGQDMVDESGRKVLLQGVGLGNWLLPEGYMWRFGGRADRPRRIEKVVSDLIGPENAARFWSAFRQNYITEADIARIAELGFNSVRPALNARLFLTEGEDAAYVEEGFQLLDHLVDWCGKHDLYVIIDMHGAPGGQTGQNIDDSANDQPELFMDKKNQDRLVDLWVKIASRYQDKPAVAGYDLLNEPLPQRTGAAPKYKDQLEPLYKRITAAIRAVDKRHMITLEGCDWANDWSVFSTPFDNNLFYQFHYYCWDRPSKLNDITRFLDQRRRLDAPVWVGETGEKDNAIYWATTQYFEAHNIGWSFWPWKKMETTNTPYSIRTPDGWDAIRTYTRNGTKPSAEAAQKAFDQLIENIKLANCVYCPDVVNAIFRRVPGRVEAENYGPEGPGQSYWVQDPRQKSEYYRLSEPVPVEPIAGGNRRDAGQAIRLTDNEWTAYVVRSLAAKDYLAALRGKAEGGPAVVEFSVNGQTQDLIVEGTDWSEIPLKAAAFRAGTNRLKLRVKVGRVFLDWLSFNEPQGQEPQESQDQAGAGPTVLALDSFDGRLGLPWDIVNPLASHWSLTKNPGTLTITTRTGSFSRNRRDYQNLFLLDHPAAPGQDFQVTTCLVSFHPADLWNQAGLVLWNDEDNYLSLVYEWGEGPPELRLENQRMFTVAGEVQGTPAFAWYYADQNLEKVWLRVTRRSDWLELSSSKDGETFVPLNPMRPGNGPIVPCSNGVVRRVGLFAGNGTARDAEPVDASFDFFEVKTLEARPRTRASRSYQLSDVVGKWSWSQGRWHGDLVLKLDGDLCMGTLNDVYEGTYDDPIQDVTVVDNCLKFTRQGRYSIQHWEGTLTEEAGALKVLDGRWTSEGGSAGRFVAEKIGGGDS
jgi:endoglucanase